jgi:high-affinity iron transporter
MRNHSDRSLKVGLLVMGLLVAGILAWQGGMALRHSSSFSAMLEIAVLVFREGLECLLVLAAVTAGMTESQRSSRNSIAIGAAVAGVATLLTWSIAVRILDDLSLNIPALQLQAATGLLAVIVLLVVMNWFFHKLYWTGWISLHTKRKWELLESAKDQSTAKLGLLSGMALLGFTSLYREGFEVVLFLQSYRLKVGGSTVLGGTCIGLFLSGIAAILTFVGHRKLPYRKMLVLTGGLLGVVLFVMVGEQAQEMQLSGWLPTTTIPSLTGVIPSWMGLWFSIFPTVETLLAQALSVLLVLGSYLVARVRVKVHPPEEIGRVQVHSSSLEA